VCAAPRKESNMRRTLTVVLVVVLFARLGLGQDAKPAGSQPGQVLPGPFTALVITNPDAPKPPEGVTSEDRSNLGDFARVGKFHDFITHYGLDPTVAVFTRENAGGADQPLSKLLQALDQEVIKNRNARLHAFAVFLMLKGPFLEDVSEPILAKQIRDLAEQLQLKAVPLALDQAKSDRTKAFDIPADATTVVLIFVNQTVQARVAFTAEKPLDDAAIQTIVSEVNKVIGAKK
jgi:hypothetical protein